MRRREGATEARLLPVVRLAHEEIAKGAATVQSTKRCAFAVTQEVMQRACASKKVCPGLSRRAGGKRRERGRVA